MKKYKLNFLILLSFFQFAFASGGVGDYSYTDNIPPSRSHPGDIALEQVPVFICLGFDDNGVSGLSGTPYDGGMLWVDTLLGHRNNPAGINNPATFDGEPLRAAFYCLGRMGIDLDWHMEPFPAVRESWKRLYDQGHEIGLHSLSHLMDGQLNILDASGWTVSKWTSDEIEPCFDILTRQYDSNDPDKGAGVDGADIWGWRTPFLHWADNALSALRDFGAVYDCSIEEGKTDDPTQYYWPYTLDNGSPAEPSVTSHPGLWEIPCYAFAVPQELRSKAGGKDKIQGLEYTVWYEEALEAQDLYTILAYTLDKRIEGNRAPMAVGVHSDVFSNGKDDQFPNASSHIARQNALRQFIDYALTKPEVRFVRPLDLIEWMRSPVGMDGVQIGIRNINISSDGFVKIDIQKNGRILIQSDKSGKFMAKITTLSGKTIFCKDVTVSSCKSGELVVPAYVASGTYLISISGAGGNFVKQVYSLLQGK